MYDRQRAVDDELLKEELASRVARGAHRVATLRARVQEEMGAIGKRSKALRKKETHFDREDSREEIILDDDSDVEILDGGDGQEIDTD
jgi:hypothetical protein